MAKKVNLSLKDIEKLKEFAERNGIKPRQVGDRRYYLLSIHSAWHDIIKKEGLEINEEAGLVRIMVD